MLRVALFLIVIALFLSCPLAMAQSGSSDQPETAQPCPKSPLEASKIATQDVQQFKKKFFSGTWTGFLHQFRLKYAACPEHIKVVYVESARQLMNAELIAGGVFSKLAQKVTNPIPTPAIYISSSSLHLWVRNMGSIIWKRVSEAVA